MNELIKSIFTDFEVSGESIPVKFMYYMEQITLGQVAEIIAFLVGLIGGIAYLNKHIRLWMSDALKGQLEPITEKIDKLGKNVNDVDMENCKNFLVMELSEIEKGVYFNEIEKERFWEEYEHYKKIGGNSYIQRKVEKLEEEDKL